MSGAGGVGRVDVPAAIPIAVPAPGPVLPQLVADAADVYRKAGSFAWHFARGKLAADPLFATLLSTGAIPDASCLVDLGCGQGLLAAWLHAARARWSSHATGGWPAGWPAAPKIGTYLGIDRSKADIARARRALPPFARVFRGDIRTMGETLLDRCDVATLFDVLQYLAPDAQERLLQAIHAGLPPWGVLVLRVGDGASTRASWWANTVDLVVCAARGQPTLRLNRRPLADWTALLDRIGFSVEILDAGQSSAPDSKKPAFANVLLRDSRRAADLTTAPDRAPAGVAVDAGGADPVASGPSALR